MGCPSGIMRTIVLDQDVDHLVLPKKKTKNLFIKEILSKPKGFIASAL